MPDPPADLRPPLAYDTPLGVGQVRPHRPGDGSIVVAVGPPPLGRQLVSALPILLLLGFFSGWVGILAFAALRRPGAIPLDKVLLVPSLIAWGFVGAEFASRFRRWSLPVQLAVAGGVFSFPYPSPRSRAEEVPASRVVRVGVERARSGLLRRDRPVLIVGLDGGATFHLLPGYPAATLEEVCELIGPALGLVSAEGMGCGAGNPSDIRPASF